MSLKVRDSDLKNSDPNPYGLIRTLGGLREAIETALETGSPIPADWDPYADLPDDAVA